MTPANTHNLSRWQLNLRLAIIILAAVVLALELLFAFFPILHRPVTPFDLNAVVACIVLIATSPRMFALALKQEFRVVPILYKIFLAIAGYLLLVKVVYFCAFLAAALFKH